jgi:two-component system sensor histidine kinase BarA
LVTRFRAEAANAVSNIEKLRLAGDAEALARAAHSMKSMAAYVSADLASDLARQIEALARAGKLIDADPLIRRLRHEALAIESWFAENIIAG